MSYFKEVPLENASEAIRGGVPALDSYVPNSVTYIVLYVLALPPNALLAYMGLKPGAINSRVKIPTLGMTLANLFGLVGFLLLNAAYLFAVVQEVKYSLFICSFLRTVLYNASYVCYFLFPLLAIDQYLFVCQNYELKTRSLGLIIAICFAIPMLVALYDLFLQGVLQYDFMFLIIRMSPHTTMAKLQLAPTFQFIFFVLAPSFFIFSFVCNLLVLSSIVRRQSKSTRQQVGRSLNSRQLQHHKSIVYTYIIQAFLPLVLATPYYVANLFFIFDVELDNIWFIVGEAVIGFHPLTNALITLLFLRPYRRAFKRLCPAFNLGAWKSGKRHYSSIRDSQRHPEKAPGDGSNPEQDAMIKECGGSGALESIVDEYTSTVKSALGSRNELERSDSGSEIRL